MLFINVFFPPSHSDQLKRHYNLGQYYLEVDLQDLTSFDEQLADKLTKSPAEFLPLVSSMGFSSEVLRMMSTCLYCNFPPENEFERMFSKGL